MNMDTVLIVGGSSGLGFALAKQLAANADVHITGRRDPKSPGLTFHHLELTDSNIAVELDALVTTIGSVDLVIYAAGFLQQARLAELSDTDIDDMLKVGVTAPAKLLRRILTHQANLPGLIAITSTSQWTPRRIEPIYTASKAGLAMLANSLSLDESVQKVLVAGPSGMQTRFWEHDPRDTSMMLEPDWVAEQILQLWQDDYQYCFAKILREPARVEVIERRSNE